MKVNNLINQLSKKQLMTTATTTISAAPLVRWVSFKPAGSDSADRKKEGTVAANTFADSAMQ